MTLRSYPQLILALLVAALVYTPALAESHRDRERELIFFGDGLSDPGNHFIAFGAVSQPPFAPVPDAPYAIGGHHFSNGATWAEQATAILKTPASGKPALRAPHIFTNYAVGRARARPDAPAFAAFDLGTQVGIFLTNFRRHVPDEATYVIWIGEDDVYDAFQALSTDPTGSQSSGIIQQALAAVADNIRALWSAGARDFLVLNVPDLGLSPAVRAAGPVAQRAASRLTAAYNGGLHHALESLSTLPHIQLRPFDTNSLIHQIVVAPQRFGLTNVQESCLTFGVVVHPVCDEPDGYLFWDGIHPTRKGHRIIAESMVGERILAGATQDAISMDFITFPDGTLIPENLNGEYGTPGTTLLSRINNQFESLGVVFDSSSDLVEISEGPPSCGFCGIPPVGGLLLGGDSAGDLHIKFLVQVRSITVEIIGSGLNISASLRAFDSHGTPIGTATHTYTGNTGILSPFTLVAPPGENIASVVYNGTLNRSAFASIGGLTFTTEATCCNRHDNRHCSEPFDRENERDGRDQCSDRASH